MGDATADTANVIGPCELPGYASVLRLPDGAGGWVAVSLTVAAHREIAERMVSMLGGEIGPPTPDDDARALCDRCGAYRQRREMVDASYPATRPGVGAMETRWVCRESCVRPGWEVTA